MRDRLNKNPAPSFVRRTMGNSDGLDVTDIAKIKKQISAGYERFAAERGIDVPLFLQARQLLSGAADYIAAAGILDEDGHHTWPRLQLTGHAVELALKACLASAGVTPAHGHDLVAFFEQAQQHGFDLDEPSCAALVHLHHFYAQDLATE